MTRFYWSTTTLYVLFLETGQFYLVAIKDSTLTEDSVGLFVRSGLINISDCKWRFSGQDGRLWSSMPGSTTGLAYYLYFGSGLNPSSNNSFRWYALPLRCLAS